MRQVVISPFWFLIFAAGRALSADGPPDVSRFLHGITVQPGETVGDVQCSGCSVFVRGTASGDVVSIGGNITIEGSVGGDAIAFGGGVHVLPVARLEGDAMAMGGSVRVEPGAKTDGEIESIPYLHVPGQRSLDPYGVVTFLAVNLAILFLGALAFRRLRMENLAAGVVRHPGMVFLAGAILGLLLTLLFALTGASKRFESLLIFLITAAVLITCMAGYLGICGALARHLAKRHFWLIGPLVGALLISFLLLIPIAGFLFFVTAFFAALGSALVSGFGKDPDWLPRHLSRRPARETAQTS